MYMYMHTPHQSILYMYIQVYNVLHQPKKNPAIIINSLSRNRDKYSSHTTVYLHTVQISMEDTCTVYNCILYRHRLLFIHVQLYKQFTVIK